MRQDTGIVDLIEQLQKAAQKDRTSIRDMLRALGPDSFIPNMMVPAMAVVSPLSGVPLFSSLCGITIALVAGQMLLRRDHIWLPDRLATKEIDSARLQKAIRTMRRPAGWLDRITRERFQILVRPPILWVTQLICMLCGLTMPFLELVPFTSTILGVAVCLFAFGMLARDGLFTLLGFATIGALIGTVLWLLP